MIEPTPATATSKRTRTLTIKGIAPQATGATEEPAVAKPKSERVLELIRRDEGATIDELTAETGWLRHTARAALTGLRKKGHAITRDKRGDMTCYYLKVA